MDYNITDIYIKLCSGFQDTAKNLRAIIEKIRYYEKLRFFLYLVGTLIVLFMSQKAHDLSGRYFLEYWFKSHRPPAEVWKKVFESYEYQDVSESPQFLKAIKNIPFHESESNGIWLSGDGLLAVVFWENETGTGQDYTPGISIYSLSESPVFRAEGQKSVKWESHPLLWNVMEPLVRRLKFSLLEYKKNMRPVAQKKKQNTIWQDPREVFY